MNLYTDLKNWLQISLGYEDIVLEKPRARDHGFLSTPVAMSLAKLEKKNPVEMAKDIKEKLENTKFYDYESLPFTIEIAGPGFLNFKIKHNYLLSKLDEYLKIGYLDFDKKNELVMVEYLSPNTNKPLHVGHLRNLSIGQSIGRLLEKCGYDIHMTEIINNRGIAICKSMLMYMLYGEGKTPQDEGKKGDHFVGDFYSMFEIKSKEDDTLEVRAQELLQKWEAGDSEVLKLWEKMNDWIYEGWKETIGKENLRFDSHYYESDIYKDGVDIVRKFEALGKFKKETEGDLKNTVVVDLTSEGLDKKVLLRSDGTAIYMTQDMVLADKRYAEYKPSRMIYITANEQDYHFVVLFKIFKIIGYPFSESCFHLSYGRVSRPEGKMSSRLGNVINIDDLRSEIDEIIAGRIKESKNTKVLEKDLDETVQKLTTAVIRYEMLKVDPKSDFVFDQKEATKLEGNTGPYLMYTYARLSSLISSDVKSLEYIDPELNEFETNLIEKLSDFKMIVERSTKEYKIHLLCTYLYELCQDFNVFYNECPVQNESDTNKKNLRLYILNIAKTVLHEGLNLVGIKTVERM